MDYWHSYCKGTLRYHLSHTDFDGSGYDLPRLTKNIAIRFSRNVLLGDFYKLRRSQNDIFLVPPRPCVPAAFWLNHRNGRQ